MLTRMNPAHLTSSPLSSRSLSLLGTSVEQQAHWSTRLFHVSYFVNVSDIVKYLKVAVPRANERLLLNSDKNSNFSAPLRPWLRNGAWGSAVKIWPLCHVALPSLESHNHLHGNSFATFT